MLQSESICGIIYTRSVVSKEYRCNTCKKLLFRGFINDGIVEIQCYRCKTINLLRSP